MKRKETRTLHGILTLMLILGLMMILGLLPETACAKNGTMTGDGSLDKPYQIEDYDDLKAFADKVNNGGERDANAELTGEIQCTDNEWEPIGPDWKYPYTGHFDGNNKNIKGLSNEESGADAFYQGLFGCIGAGGLVEEVRLVGGMIKGQNYVGSIVGQLVEGGHITNCNNSGEVNGSGENVGGVAGMNYMGKITDCNNSGEVSGDTYVGGVTGENEKGEITNCHNSGEVSGSGERVGGVAGWYNKGTITNCYNTGAVSGSNNVGGVVGYGFEEFHADSVAMKNCYNSGAVSGGSQVGGVLGYGDDAGKITNCYNTGAVSGSNNVSGVAGRLHGGGEVTNCYSSGAVSGDTDVGGVAGQSFTSTANCYHDKTLSGIMQAVSERYDSANLKGLPTSDMTGDSAIGENHMNFQYPEGEESPWLVKPNGIDGTSGEYYEYYPHLKGFNLDSEGKQLKAEEIAPADWPAKAIVKADWDGSGPYEYDGSVHKPVLERIIVSKDSLEVPEGMEVKYYTMIVVSEIQWSWSELTSGQPVSPGNYKMVITDGSDIISEQFFAILDPAADYTVAYYKQTGEDSGTGEPIWNLATTELVDVGNYKAVVTFENGGVLEKKFEIGKAEPTIDTAPTASAITYGQTLADSTLTGGLAKAGDAEIPGTFAWQDETIKPDVADSNKTEYEVTFTPTDTTKYMAVTTKVKLTVNKASLTITAEDQTYDYDGQPHGEGDPVYDDPAVIAKKVKTKGLKNSDAITSIILDGSETNAGEYDIVPSSAAVGKATDNYDIAYVNGKLTIKEAQPVIETVPAASAITYGQSLADSTLTGGLAKAGTAEVPGTFAWKDKTIKPDAADSDKTEYEVTFTPTDTKNYKAATAKVKLTVNKADITPTVSIEGWTYGSAANTPSVDGNLGGGDVTFRYKEKEAPDTAYTDKVPTDAGTYTVKADVAETENYSAGSATLDFTISPADMQVTSSGFDGDFDGGAHSITVNAPEGAEVYYAGPGGSFTIDNPAFTDVGTYAVEFKVRLKNYKEYDGTENVVIHQAKNTVTVSIEGWTYGEPAHIPTVEATFGADKATLAYSDAPDGTYQPGGPDQAGIWYVKATVPETKDYARAESQPTAFEIAKAKITIAADDKTSLCGKDMAELTYTLSGAYVEGDELGIALSTDADQNKPGTYPIMVSWNENPNYNATLVNGTYKVTGISDAEKKAARIALDAGLKGTSAKGTVTAKWGKVKKADKYVVYATYCGVNKKCKKIRTVSGETTKIDIKKLAGKKLNVKRSVKYYVVAYRTVEGKSMKLARSRTVHVVGSGNENASNIKSIKVKKRSYKLKPGETAKIKAKLVLYKKDKKPLGHAAEFRYDTSNEKVAKVSENGKIKAVGAGKCKIYVYAQNGCAKKINVTVK